MLRFDLNAEVEWLRKEDSWQGVLTSKAMPIYYNTGSPDIVTTMKETLTGADEDEDEIRSEDFAEH
jgi:hypothetical protein